MKNLYDKIEPWIKTTAVLATLLSALLVVQKATAFDGRLTSLEVAYNRLLVVDEKLDLVIKILRDK